MRKNRKIVKRFTLFRPRIRSRHPSHAVLRPSTKVLPLFPVRSVIRFGSNTEMDSTRYPVEVNSVKAIKNSSNKKLMKECFDNDGVKTATWWTYKGVDNIDVSELPYPIISKSLYGSRNRGNIKHDSADDLAAWIEGKDLNDYIFEKYYNFTREYRLHVTEEGCFYSCRKMLKSDAPKEDRWFRNDAHCVWIMPDNELFDKPSNWDEIEAECVKALKSVGLDVGAIDLRVQSATKKGEIRENPEFIVVEINSAASFGEVTTIKYIEVLPSIIHAKIAKLNL
jgi:D-alanine-D-alanine ligase-like ATP-grasp enzyme